MRINTIYHQVLLISLFMVCSCSEVMEKENLLHPDLITEKTYQALTYRHIGPEGNRVIAIAGIPGNPDIIFTGAASGGIWKSTDGGLNWNPVFDKEDVSSIGALAVSESNPDVIWAGTGETNIRSSISIGKGVYKSTDAGESWDCMGLEKTGRIGRILIHPENPDIVYVAALGTIYGPQPERGVFRTLDGGKNWKRVLFADEQTGAMDMTMQPGNPKTIIASMWPITLKTWERGSGGPSGGIYISHDAGDTWEKITRGLPKGDMGKIAVDFAPGNPLVVYAIIETDQYEYNGVLWKSEDGGISWQLASYDQEYITRPHYYTRIVVSPDNENEFYSLATTLTKSSDGGKTSKSTRSLGGDHHDMWIDPLNPNRILSANDQGIQISSNRGKSWYRLTLPVAQMYHVSVDDQIPYFVYGNRQDGPTYRVPSNSLAGGRVTSIGGGEAGFTFADPFDNNVIWASNEQGVLERYDLETGQAVNVQVWPETPVGKSPRNIKYRWIWSYPFILSTHKQNTLYAGSQYVHKTTDGGKTWKVISPDLTLNDTSMQVHSGGLTIDNVGVDYGNTLYALAESPLNKMVLWAGSNDGLVHVTKNGGKSWTNVTDNLPDLPPFGTVSSIEASRYNLGAAYLAVTLHQVDNRDPFIYKTKDYGQSWTKITNGIPAGMLSFTHIVREDPQREGMLYTGTENEVYFSYDDGDKWMPLRNNMPSAPIRWLCIQDHFSDLVIGTYGRGFWIMDDITPLRQLDDRVLESKAHLFTPRPAYRFQQRSLPGGRKGFLDRDKYFQDPEYGASINYYLKDPSDSLVSITILDQYGIEIKTFEGPADTGINRTYWDLRYEDSPEIELRTPPLDYPDAALKWFKGEYNKEGWRSLKVEGSGENGPLAIPGIYTIVLRTNEMEFRENLEVKKDPLSKASQEDIEAQIKLALNIRERVNELTAMGNSIQWIRKRLDEIQEDIPEPQNPIYIASNELEEKLIEIEINLYQLRGTGASENLLRFPAGLFSHFKMLGNYVMRGDHRPTASKYEVYEELTRRLDTYLKEYNSLVENELKEFNVLLVNDKKGPIKTVARNEKLYPVKPGNLVPGIRAEKDEIDFMRSMADSIYLNSRGYWEAVLPHGIVMIHVPPGEFTMGNNDLNATTTNSNPSSPEHRVKLSHYWIGKTPVTIGQFRAFIEETDYVTSVEKPATLGCFVYDFPEQGFVPTKGYNWRNSFERVSKKHPEITVNDQHPVNCVSWEDARAFCNWLAAETGLRIKLPTEAQWEYAARGPENYIYPWGNEDPDGSRANYADESFNLIFPGTGQSLVHHGVDDGYPITSPVGSFPEGASPFGALDMAGNLSEWVYDREGLFGPELIVDPIGPSRGDSRAMKAGFWAGSAGRMGQTPDEIEFGHNIRADARQGDDPVTADDHLGFRIAIHYVITK